MPRELTHDLEASKRELERQDQAWAEVEAQLRALSSLRVAVTRRMVDDIDEAFAASSRAALSIHHKFC
jgi:hypothetical protein